MSSADTIFNYIFGYFVKMYYYFQELSQRELGKIKNCDFFQKNDLLSKIKYYRTVCGGGVIVLILFILESKYTPVSLR